MMKSKLKESTLVTMRCGFIPLLDCAVPVVAKELGFAESEGINLELHKETSWANIRDRVIVGHHDGAHMLSGMAIACNLGLGSVKAEIVAPFSLGMNGNAITVSNDLFSEMSDAAGVIGDEDPMQMAKALAAAIQARKNAGKETVKLGMVYPFSCHNYELRYWLAAAGINPEHDTRIFVIPPSLMVEYLEGGFVDGFCVGEPWNSFATASGNGRLIVANANLWNMGPEKVLGIRAEWIEQKPESTPALIRAMDAAAQWADDPNNHFELARILARSEYVGGHEKDFEEILTGNIKVTAEEKTIHIDNLVLFHKNAANFPWISHALWVYSQMVRWGQITDTPENRKLAVATYRPDLYREALKSANIPMPSQNSKVEGSLNKKTLIESENGQLFLGPDQFFDNRQFDPHQLDEYIASFEIKNLI